MTEFDRHYKLTETRDQKIVIFEEQYRFLRQEILERQQRRFYIVTGASLGIPGVSGLKLSGVLEGTFIYLVPLIVVAMSFLFIIEVNGIARAGKFIERRIENQHKDVLGWEHFLKDHYITPAPVRIANRSFLILMAVYYLFSSVVSFRRLALINFQGNVSETSLYDVISDWGFCCALVYAAVILVVFFCWMLEIWPSMHFSAEEQK